MFNIKLKPRAYRIREILVMRAGFPGSFYQLQCLTRLGWNAIHLFEHPADANKALKEWRDTL